MSISKNQCGKASLVSVVIIALSLMVSGVIIWSASHTAFSSAAGPHNGPDRHADGGYPPGPPHPHGGPGGPHPDGPPPPPPNDGGRPYNDGPPDHGYQGEVSIDSGHDSRSYIDSSDLFNGSNISPGYSEEKCVTLTSHSDSETFIKMYGDNFTFSPLATALKMNIDEGSMSGDTQNDSCSSFKEDKAVYAGSLAGFGTNAHDYRTGLSGVPNGDALAPHGHTTYRITLGLPRNTDNSVAGQQTSAAFEWEAQE